MPKLTYEQQVARLPQTDMEKHHILISQTCLHGSPCRSCIHNCYKHWNLERLEESKVACVTCDDDYSSYRIQQASKKYMDYKLGKK